VSGEVPFPILRRTAGWIAIDKPAGLPSRPAPGGGPSALSLLEDWLREHAPGPHPPGVVHRLDRETSGVLLFSLEPRAHRLLARAFAEGTVRKEYAAVVAGLPRPRRGRIDLPLSRNASGRTIVDRRGRPATTRYLTVAAREGAALLALFPQTGRTHQIRVHLAARGTPVLGDRIYGFPRGVTPDGSLPRPPRLCLHAARLRLPAALAEEEEEEEEEPDIVAALPPDLCRYLTRLGLPARPAAGRE